MLAALVLITLTITLSSLPNSRAIRCCDSSRSYQSTLTTNLKDATDCYETMNNTQGRRPEDRNKGKRGNNCDFCTIEVFKVPKRDLVVASTDTDTLHPEVPETKQKYYYLQSCDSFTNAQFEEDLKTDKKMIQWINFGADLEKKDKGKLKRACKIHSSRNGLILNINTNEVGLEVPPYVPVTTDCTKYQDCGNGYCSKSAKTCKCYKGWVNDGKGSPCDKVLLDDVESISCACFDNECNGDINIIPTEEDWKRTLITWKYE